MIGTEFVFENILERDMDMLLMRQFAYGNTEFKNCFMETIGLKWSDEFSIKSIAHSVMTNDGESDIEIIISDGSENIAFLIEDKIDAEAQPEQSKRYEIRAKKAVTMGKYDKYHIFIVAPQKYLDGNQEAHQYPNRLSYEAIREVLDNAYDRAIVDKALDESSHGYVPIEDRKVTEFWNQLYDFVDDRFPDTFNIHGKKGDSRGARAQWVTINSGKGTTIQIKADRGYVDLEISGYAEKFMEFSKANQELLDKRRLYLRIASKSLAIRKYIEPIDFQNSFEEQIDKIDDALCKAKELQDLIKFLKLDSVK